MLRVQEISLCFAEVSEMCLVHQVIADRPVVGKVVLLVALLSIGAEVERSRAACLKTGVGIEQGAVVEIVVSGEVLLVVDAMVKLERELIGPIFMNSSDSLEGSVRAIGAGNELIHQVDRGRVHALCRNYIAGKDVREICPGSNRGAAGCRHRTCASGPSIQGVGYVLVGQYAGKWGLSRKVTRTLFGRRHQNRIR